MVEVLEDSTSSQRVFKPRGGGLTHDQAMRSIDLFVGEIMPHYRLPQPSPHGLPGELLRGEEDQHDA
jgi:hypothetical protein